MCKTSVSYETSSKSHPSSLQNEHFARDFFQNSLVKYPKRDFLKNSPFKSAKRAFRARLPPKSRFESAKRAFRTRLPPKVKREARSTHIDHPCRAVSRFQPLQTTPAHTPIPMSQRHSPPPQIATSRLPVPATKIYVSTRLTHTHTHTKYGACHEL